MTAPCLLLVESNPISCKMVRTALENEDLIVLEAPNARAALELAAAGRVDLVLQELLLPDMDGFELVAKLRALPGGAETPILALSGFVSALEEARMSSVGFDDVVMKPIESSRLRTIIRAHLPSSASASEQIGAGRRLIVVDDDAVQRKLACFRLGRLGFITRAAADGLEALELARREPPDAIVSDVMMPRLDGFGLCSAIRQDGNLGALPVILMTNSYLEEADRQLALRAGANALVLRTPELSEVMQSLTAALRADGSRSAPRGSAIPLEFESEHARRIARQLERQVIHNTGLARRCSALTAELTVLAGISEAALKQRDIETTLDEALAACFDAGGVSLGALYLVTADGSFRARPIGADAARHEADLQTFFGQRQFLHRIIGGRVTTSLAAPALPAAVTQGIIERCGGTSALIVPLVHQDKPLGALLMVTKRSDLAEDDWRIFAQGVGNQIAQALALATALSERESARQEALRQEQLANERAALLERILISISGVAEKLGLADVANAYRCALDCVAVPSSSASGQRSNDDFAAALVPFETAFRGYIEANDRLAGLNAILAEQNRQLTKANAATDTANRELEAFSYSVAHDLRAPLRSIEGFSRVLVEDYSDVLDAKGQEYLGRVSVASLRMTELIDDLLQLSRVSRETLSRGVVDLSRLARMVVAELQTREPERRIELVVEDELSAEVDGRLIKIVLENLLGNAWKFTSKVACPRIEFRCLDSVGGHAWFVRDNGAGFDMTYAAKLFAPFQRLHSGQDFPGTGIGLATVQRIIHRHDGRVWAEGTPGQGATFYFTLGVGW